LIIGDQHARTNGAWSEHETAVDEPTAVPSAPRPAALTILLDTLPGVFAFAHRVPQNGRETGFCFLPYCRGLKSAGAFAKFYGSRCLMRLNLIDGSPPRKLQE
jgi:hypothetical protein